MQLNRQLNIRCPEEVLLRSYKYLIFTNSGLSVEIENKVTFDL